MVKHSLDEFFHDWFGKLRLSSRTSRSEQHDICKTLYSDNDHAKLILTKELVFLSLFSPFYFTRHMADYELEEQNQHKKGSTAQVNNREVIITLLDYYSVVITPYKFKIVY